MSLEHSPARDNGIDSLRVIPDKEMPGLLNISPATWERSKKAGDKPTVTQLSARRIGYRVDHIRHWLDGKRRSSVAAQ
jgi:hypothetical protein